MTAGTGTARAPHPKGAGPIAYPGSCTTLAAPAQNGPRVAAITIYLYSGQFPPKKRAAQALGELSGIPASPRDRRRGHRPHRREA